MCDENETGRDRVILSGVHDLSADPNGFRSFTWLHFTFLAVSSFTSTHQNLQLDPFLRLLGQIVVTFKT